jgi:peroxiredoxin
MVTQVDSYKLQLGDPAPKFSNLPGVDGKTYSLDSFKDKKALVIVWYCNHCPYAQAYRDRFNDVAKDYMAKGVAFVAINSNDATQYPEDAFEPMKMHAKQHGLVFHYLFDESQAVAEAYGAMCTPHVLAFDQQGSAEPQAGTRKGPSRGARRAACRAAREGAGDACVWVQRQVERGALCEVQEIDWGTKGKRTRRGTSARGASFAPIPSGLARCPSRASAS